VVSPGLLISSTNKTEIPLKVALNTIKTKQNQFSEKNTPKTLLHAIEVTISET
jgi:hypothetical protein